MLNQKIKTKQTFRKVVDRTTTEIITKHPRLFTIAMGFAITLAVGTALGMMPLDSHNPQAFATNMNLCDGCGGSQGAGGASKLCC